ncbi:hypothetical protein [Kribbella sp. NPDC051718]|uniref:hypothetical protein n=1 Tax=Kribbella sp. NPDC051718 TaxID=3155168 RepID=UPI00342168E8
MTTLINNVLGDAIDDRIAEALDDYLAEGRLDGKIRPRRSAVGIATLVAGGVAVVLLPWVLILAVTLPSTYEANNWNLAWIGLDLAIAVTAGLTAFLLHRRDPRAALTAVAAGTLLVADAWFDISTSGPGLDHHLALAQGLVLELPLAICAFVLASRTLRPRPERATIGLSVPALIPRATLRTPGHGADSLRHRSASGRAV